MTVWHPAIPDGPEPLYERLVSALRRDITSGLLRPGDRIPPQRELAHGLGVGIGTVTRAYAEAARRGLLRALVGSGSFVTAAAAIGSAGEASGVLDLTRNTIPHGPASARLSATLAQLRRRGDLLDHLAYAPPEGSDAHRQAATKWMARAAGLETDWRRVICTGGAQQAMSLVLGHLCRPGDTVMCEAATFYGFKALASLLELNLQGLAMDEQGLLPEAVDRAASAGARVLYLMPTLQNPTGRLMSPERRAEIAAVARRRDLILVEDDSYAIFGPGGAYRPIAALAPERTYYVGGLSKALSAGLRAGWLVAPDTETVERLVERIRALYYAPPAFGALVATQWIEDGSADEIAAEVRAELARRCDAARLILGERLEPPAVPHAPHLWLPMSELAAERAAARAHRGGVELTPPGAPLVDPDLCSGLRVCLGAAPDLATLEQALATLATALSAGPETPSRGLV